MSAFTEREAALGAFTSAQSTGRGRVMGADPQAVYAARKATWTRVLALVNAAVGTPRTLVREPGDVDLDAMEAHAQGELDRLDVEEGRRAFPQMWNDRDHGGLGVGPRTWIHANGAVEQTIVRVASSRRARATRQGGTPSTIFPRVPAHTPCASS